MKSPLHYFTVAALGGMLLVNSSCQNQLDTVRLAPKVELTQDAKEKLMNDFSTGFAKALQNEPALRAYIKMRALEQFDGDYDVFYLINKDDKVDGENTLHQVLNKHISQVGLLANIENNFLDLNIKVLPFNGRIEDWSTQDFSPSVVVRSFDEKASGLNSYNGQGVKTTVSARERPGALTVVVEESERIHINSYETMAKDWNASVVKFLPYNLEGEAKKQSAVSNRTAATVARECVGRRCDPAWWLGTCPRKSTEAVTENRNLLDNITLTKSAFEYASDTWTEGRLDIIGKLLTVRGDSKALDEAELVTQVYKERTVTFTGTNPRGSQGTYTQTIYGYDEKHDFNAVMGKWDNTLNGDTWKLSFREIDPGGNEIKVEKSFASTFEAGIKSTDAAKNVIGFNASYKGSSEGKTTVVYHDVDETLGDQFIYYCDKFGSTQLYDTGSLKFVITPLQ
ncbi:MAG: hypothetical protein EOO61_11510 [Hymenobacter sp.]|nr:MAG: hypothetical protein EOO61_11510 [Hymenobacter sp.]